jgi:hypothetical protein
MPENEKRESPNPVTSLEQMGEFAGKVVRYSRDGGITFKFGLVEKHAVKFESGSIGYNIDNEVSPKGGHSSTSVTGRDFESCSLLVEIADPEEVREITFSYQSIIQKLSEQH